MREPLFIKKNKEKWEQYDAEPTNDPNILSERFTNILDDLAYAQTFYPKGKTVQYLNERAVNFYNQIYQKKKEPLSKIFDFWRVDLPLVIRRNHRFLLLATIIFIAFFLVGTLSAMYDDGFLDAMLGRSYIDMTKDNIANGNPFGVYGDSGATAMFFRIAFNNILLAFTRSFLGGAPLAVVDTYFLMQTGMMVGGFHYLFFEANLGWEFTLVVMIHGTFELFAIVLASAAGFRLFHSLVFTGTYSRIESIKKGFSDGMQLMILVFILLLVAAFLESYITRLAAASIASNGDLEFIPIWVSVLILVACTAIILWYFVIYPIRVARKYKKLMETMKAENNLGIVTIASK